MDLCGPMRVASVNGKNYSSFIVMITINSSWVKLLMSIDEAPDFLSSFLRCQVRLMNTLSDTSEQIMEFEFVNQTLHEYYEKVVSHETSVVRFSPQNGVIKRRNHMLIDAARTMLIYAKALLFLWAKAVATACYTQNRSIVRLNHEKPPHEILHDKPPDLTFFHVFGALCYPINNSENLGSYNRTDDIVDTPMVEKFKLDEDKEGKVVDPSPLFSFALSEVFMCVAQLGRSIIDNQISLYQRSNVENGALTEAQREFDEKLLLKDYSYQRVKQEILDISVKERSDDDIDGMTGKKTMNGE
ncbi:retrovirus-related pol polyprotein from transposon TNT 1-94 [Tanacetum coccineum]